MYARGQVPLDVDDLTFFVDEEFKAIEDAFSGLSQQQLISLRQRYSEPNRPRDGDIVHADGTEWDPGSGKGLYIYSDSAWVQIVAL